MIRAIPSRCYVIALCQGISNPFINLIVLSHSYTEHSLRRHRGLTLIELTIVLAVMMALLAILFVGARAWRMGSDRSSCILNQRSMQMAVRSYQNMHGLRNGPLPNGESLPEALRSREFINDYLYQCAIGAAVCPGGGEYTIEDPSQFPEYGVLFMTCSLAELRGHIPADTSDW
jgi:type II secretory pathway pseudopilin PulG